MRPRQKQIRLSKIITFGYVLLMITVFLGIFVVANVWNPEPSAEDVNKRRAEINKQLTVQLDECIAGNSDVIVGLHNCRPFKNHKDARIWRVK